MNARIALSAALTLALATASPADDRPATWPDRDLPPHFTRQTLFGEPADFSHDGKRVLFLEKTFGDVYEVDLETEQPRLLTGHYRRHGYTRQQRGFDRGNSRRSLASQTSASSREKYRSGTRIGIRSRIASTSDRGA
jgi:hypothetical protein